MKNFTLKTVFVIALVLLSATAATAFNNDEKNSKDSEKASKGGSNPAVTVLKGTGKAAVIVVGSAAKVAWGTTKFTAKHMVKPVAKAVFVKAAPKMTLFVLKNSGTILKKALPIAIKLAVL